MLNDAVFHPLGKCFTEGNNRLTMQNFSIKQWSVWDLTENQEFAGYQHVYSGQPVLQGIKPMVKRRMPSLAKPIHELSKDTTQMPTVYASKNAELSKTIKIIRQFGGDISPTMFSMSVHNAIPGMLSVIDHDESPYTVIDSMSGVVEMAVFEAISLLTKYETIRVVYFEEATAAEFLDQTESADLAVVLQIIIAAGHQFSLETNPIPNANKPKTSSNALIKDYLSFLQGDVDNVTHQYARNSWLWKRS